MNIRHPREYIDASPRLACVLVKRAHTVHRLFHKRNIFSCEWGLGEFNASTSLFSSVEQTALTVCSTKYNNVHFDSLTITHVRARRLTRNRKQFDLGRNQTQGPIIQRLVATVLRSTDDGYLTKDSLGGWTGFPLVPLCSNSIDPLPVVLGVSSFERFFGRWMAKHYV